MIHGNMMTLSNGNIFRVTDLLCGEFSRHRWILRTKASGRSFDVFFDLLQSQQLSKQWRSRWSEMPSRPLCRHCNEICLLINSCTISTTQINPLSSKVFYIHTMHVRFQWFPILRRWRFLFSPVDGRPHSYGHWCWWPVIECHGVDLHVQEYFGINTWTVNINDVLKRLASV